MGSNRSSRELPSGIAPRDDIEEASPEGFANSIGPGNDRVTGGELIPVSGARTKPAHISPSKECLATNSLSFWERWGPTIRPRPSIASLEFLTSNALDASSASRAFYY